MKYPVFKVKFLQDSSQKALSYKVIKYFQIFLSTLAHHALEVFHSVVKSMKNFVLYGVIRAGWVKMSRHQTGAVFIILDMLKYALLGDFVHIIENAQSKL